MVSQRIVDTAADLPPYLARFDLDRLARETASVIALDGAYVIRWVNSGWEQFARENQGDEVLHRWAPGASYLDGIAGPLRDLFKSAFDNAQLVEEPFELEYECSSPECFRACQLRGFPFKHEGLLLSHTVVVETPHERVASAALEARYRDATGGMILQCANCRRVRRPDARSWDWIPAWVEHVPEDTSHGICPACRGYYWGMRKT